MDLAKLIHVRKETVQFPTLARGIRKPKESPLT